MAVETPDVAARATWNRSPIKIAFNTSTVTTAALELNMAYVLTSDQDVYWSQGTAALSVTSTTGKVNWARTPFPKDIYCPGGSNTTVNHVGALGINAAGTLWLMPAE